MGVAIKPCEEGVAVVRAHAPTNHPNVAGTDLVEPEVALESRAPPMCQLSPPRPLFAHVQVKQYEDDLGRARSTGQEASQAALARRLLSFCQPPYCDARAAIMNEWVALIGFQPDNAANQLEHLSSLIVSYGASNGGDYARAVEAAHAKLIGPVEKWRSHIGLTDTRGEATPRARKASPLVRLHGGGAGAHMTERCDKVRAVDLDA